MIHGALFGLSALLSHVVTVRGLPRVMTQLARWKLGAKPNQLYHQDLPPAETASIVKPCPDLLYSGCYYDLAAGPLVFEVPRQDDYFSVAGYASDTTAYFVRDDVDCEGDRLTLTLSHASSRAVDAVGAWIVSPSRTGFLIVRALVSDRTQLPRMRERQRAIRLQALADFTALPPSPALPLRSAAAPVAS
jgi:uncharacterized membrane protein